MARGATRPVRLQVDAEGAKMPVPVSTQITVLEVGHGTGEKNRRL